MSSLRSLESTTWSALPVIGALKRAVGLRPRDLPEVASRSWEIAAPAKSRLRPAYFLPDQLDRVTGTAFGAFDHQVRSLRGNVEIEHGPTRGFLVRNVWLLDGVLYHKDAARHLHPRANRLPTVRAERQIEKGAIYCSWAGNRYFFNWLADDCVTYPLAESEGEPITVDRPIGRHGVEYETWLGMKPTRVRDAFFRELVVFEDTGQNRSKHQRFRTIAQKLTGQVEAKPHPGVFILRGTTGDRRILRNERALAEQLRLRRGFRILDPAETDVGGIVAACAGARVVVGVEGSGIIHGVAVLPPGGAVLLLEPPNRFCSLYKDLTDRDGQNYAFVVGFREGEDFRIDPDEVERTLDLLPP